MCPELPGNPAQIEPPEARFSLTLEEYIHANSTINILVFSDLEN